MPVYEYRCDACGEITETLRKMSDADASQVCEHCGSEATRRVQSVFAAGGSGEADPPPGCGQCGQMGGACPYQ